MPACRRIWACCRRRACSRGLADEGLVSLSISSEPVCGRAAYHAEDPQCGFSRRPIRRGRPAPRAGRRRGLCDPTRERGDFTIRRRISTMKCIIFKPRTAGWGGVRVLSGPVAAAAAGRRLWLKGHGTGTLETAAWSATRSRGMFPARRSSAGKAAWATRLAVADWWSGAGCGGDAAGRTPGTVGSVAPVFSDSVAREIVANGAYDGAVCASNRWRAHAAFLLSHA